MEWLETIRIIFLTVSYNTLAAIGMALFVIGLASGVNLGIARLPERFLPTWRGVLTTIIQFVIFLGGIIGVFILTNLGAALIFAAIIAAFCAGALFSSPNPISDRLATLHIRTRAYYTAGDMVTIGAGYSGRVTMINARCTELESAERGVVILPNSLVIRNPIVLQRETSQSDIAPLETAPLAMGQGDTSIPADEISSLSSRQEDTVVLAPSPLTEVEPTLYTTAPTPLLSKAENITPRIPDLLESGKMDQSDDLDTKGTDSLVTAADIAGTTEEDTADNSALSTESSTQLTPLPILFLPKATSLLKKRPALGKHTILPLRQM